ncbi:hypothetical protein N7456_011140 [Penicillium angulare]|uniref:BZIP domain-containing protein n=1 Tax=Penicillium angulare TaxID=116970 RepID=A0A9W9JZE7_9EURO|nr:hypothetical protein N7456_011140 [Penicillium angulare]
MYPVQPYPLQSNTNLENEADCMAIEDPKEKKKIQNRLSQRKYRQRMKARLERLQSTVDYHERMRLYTTHDRAQEMAGGISDVQLGNQMDHDHALLDVQEGPSIGTSDCQHETEKGTFSGLGLIEQLENPHDQPFALDDLGCIDLTLPTPSDICYPEILPQTPQQNISPAHLFSSTSTQELNETTSSESKSNIGIGRMDSSQTIQTISTSPNSVSTMSLSEKLEYILECANEVGISNFDSLATAYYSETPSDSSSVAYEQRISRNRRLPSVISDIFQSANSWSEWERRGLQEEILKQTESMLVSEGGKTHMAFLSGVNTLADANNGVGVLSKEQATLEMKRTIQNELPNLWAMMMALVGDSRPSWQPDRSNTALAAVILLKLSGAMPGYQLMSLLEMCL